MNLKKNEFKKILEINRIENRLLSTVYEPFLSVGAQSFQNLMVLVKLDDELGMMFPKFVHGGCSFLSHLLENKLGVQLVMMMSWMIRSFGCAHIFLIRLKLEHKLD